MTVAKKETVKKTLRVQIAPNGMQEIRWNNGGEVPQVLGGYYTSTPVAQDDIDTYMKTKAKA